MNYKNDTITIEEFNKLKAEKKIFIDESFQVGTDEVSRWSKREQKRFLVSVFRGWAPSPLILVDIQACYDYHMEVGIDDESIEYYGTLLDLGYKYVSVDGNNRSITLLLFAKNELMLPHGDYTDKLNRAIPVRKGKDRINTINKILKDEFLTREISITVYTKIAKSNLYNLFLGVNDGMSLNNQQKRQAHPSLLAQWVRDKRKQYKGALQKFIKNKAFVVLKGDEFIAKCIAYAAYDETDKKTLDNVYKKSQAGRFLKPNKTDTKFNQTMNTFLTTIKNAKSLNNLKESPNALFDYFCLSYDYKVNNIKIDKPQMFFDLWLKTAGNLFAESIGNKPKMYEYEKKSGQKANETFKDITRHPYKNAQLFRKKMLRDKIEESAFKDGILIQQEDPDDYFSYDEKVIMWNRQNGICPGTGKKIPYDEIGVHTKWQGDAIIPKDKGGKHVLENGQLVCAKYNNKKSNN
jgi:hypothetical protein|tara:strand:+ start:65 stop:1453 length:1389 start_codon:yes stop_codon:yes gene_type:complete